MASEKVILVQVDWKRTQHFHQEDEKEMVELVRSAGGNLTSTIHASIDKPSPSHFIRSGKVEEIRQKQIATKATLAIFNIDLSPGQSRNIEDDCGLRVVDRTGLILDIFARRAQSSEGRLQVELAQLNYLLPRLVGQGVLMSRLGGGIGTRGPGEQKLEIDRRKIRARISRIKGDLKKVEKHRGLLRKSRKRKAFHLISVVGYTNAGKSTLLNALTGAQVLTENKLFATLDPTTRIYETKHGAKMLFTDTVGFIQNLPHHLVEAFKATLEEVTEADILVHVLDVSNPFVEHQFETVNKILEELKALNKPIILALNKIDQLLPPEINRFVLKFHGGIPISAKNKINLESLIAGLEESILIQNSLPDYTRQDQELPT